MDIISGTDRFKKNRSTTFTPEGSCKLLWTFEDEYEMISWSYSSYVLCRSGTNAIHLMWGWNQCIWFDSNPIGYWIKILTWRYYVYICPPKQVWAIRRYGIEFIYLIIAFSSAASLYFARTSFVKQCLIEEIGMFFVIMFVVFSSWYLLWYCCLLHDAVSGWFLLSVLAYVWFCCQICLCLVDTVGQVFLIVCHSEARNILARWNQNAIESNEHIKSA